MSLEEWIEAHGLSVLRDQWLCHFDAYGGHNREDAEALARLCMISLRDQLESP